MLAMTVTLIRNVTHRYCERNGCSDEQTGTEGIYLIVATIELAGSLMSTTFQTVALQIRM